MQRPRNQSARKSIIWHLVVLFIIVAISPLLILQSLALENDSYRSTLWFLLAAMFIRAAISVWAIIRHQRLRSKLQSTGADVDDDDDHGNRGELDEGDHGV